MILRKNWANLSCWIIWLKLIILFYSNIGVLMNYLGFATWLSIGAAVFCLPYLRWKQPDLPRPIKINLGFPIVYLLMTLVITLLPMLAQPVETGIGLAMILTAVPVYLIFIQWQGKPSWLTSFTILTTDQLQRLLVVMPPGKEE